jgi:hypothetical protein
LGILNQLTYLEHWPFLLPNFMQISTLVTAQSRSFGEVLRQVINENNEANMRTHLHKTENNMAA